MGLPHISIMFLRTTDGVPIDEGVGISIIIGVEISSLRGRDEREFPGVKRGDVLHVLLISVHIGGVNTHKRRRARRMPLALPL